MGCIAKNIAKKIAVSAVFLLFFMTFLSFSAQEVRADTGSTGTSIFNALHTVFGFLDVVSLDKIGVTNDPSTFAAKAIIGILIFSLLFFASKSIFGEHKNIGIVVSLAITLMVLIAVPSNVLKSLIETYSVVALAILYLVPIAAVAYLQHIVKQKVPGRAGHLAVFFLYLLLLYLLSQFKGGILTEFVDKGASYAENIASFTDVLLGIILIMIAIELVKFAKGDSGISSLSLPSFGGGGFGSSSGAGSGAAGQLQKLEKKAAKEAEKSLQNESAEKRMVRGLEELEQDQIRLGGEIQNKTGAELHDIESIHTLISNLAATLTYVRQNQKTITAENRQAFMAKVNERIGGMLAQLNQYFTDLGNSEKTIRAVYVANFNSLEAKKKSLFAELIKRKDKTEADLKNMTAKKSLSALTDRAKREINDAIGLHNVLEQEMNELKTVLERELNTENQVNSAVRSAYLLQMRLQRGLQELIASLKAGNIDAADANINGIDGILKNYRQIVEFNQRAEKILVESDAKEIELEKQMEILEKKLADLSSGIRNEESAAAHAAQP